MDIIIDLQESGTRKMQLTIAISFADELFESLLSRHQDNLETLMRGINFIFDSVQLMNFKCHKLNLTRGVHILILQIG